ncbi:MAG: N-6 DNA methylase [Armatimonadetes bacterium]|nr:N-6 DNA methylase [Armatimonadota bacterium]
MFDQWSEETLIGVALRLGARSVAGWHAQEEALAQTAHDVPSMKVEEVEAAILAGQDVLGEAFLSLRSSQTRRALGATYTPEAIVEAMATWAASQGAPQRIIDPGCGSGRYLRVAGSKIADARLVGVEIDPVASIVARGTLAAAGLGKRSEVHLQDFRSVSLPGVTGTSVYLGNPPYVRHHGIEPEWKGWLSSQAENLGIRASQLAGLHVHFFLATALTAKEGDYGAYITASEWLDVNYGSLVRELFLNRLGGQGIVVVDPTAQPFPDAAVTGAVTYFKVGSRAPRIMLTRVKALDELLTPKHTRAVRRERLESEPRWSHLTRTAQIVPEDYVELGELCRVHRGTVTGANHVWIAGEHSSFLPEAVLQPTVTRAREILALGEELADASVLKRVIDLPDDLDILDKTDRKLVDRFLTVARELGGDQGYVAQNRKSWWAVRLRKPAPILATYMARRSPGFVINRAEARHINIAHGLYPRESLSDHVIRGLVRFLSRNIDAAMGRTYAGGLTKFEPREMERLLVPTPKVLIQQTA